MRGPSRGSFQTSKARPSCASQQLSQPSGQSLMQGTTETDSQAIGDGLSGGAASNDALPTRQEGADGRVTLSLWRALVSGEWALVDVYEHNGKRYVVARRNDVRPLLPKPLSPRERQALEFAGRGESNKVIAYEMGICASTVGVLLHRAAQKLGCQTRSELLARFHEFVVTAPGMASNSSVRPPAPLINPSST